MITFIRLFIKLFLVSFFICFIFIHSKVFYKGQQYEQIGEFRNGFASVSKKNFWGREKWGFIDTKGKLIIGFIYEDAWYFDENGLGIVSKGFYSKDKKKLYGFVRKTDGFYFDEVRTFKKNIASVRKNDFFSGKSKWGFINRKLKIVVPIIYDNIEPFKNEYAKGKKGTNIIYFNTKAEIFNFFAKCKKKEFKNYVIIEREGLYGVINENQQTIKKIEHNLNEINDIYY